MNATEFWQIMGSFGELLAPVSMAIWVYMTLGYFLALKLGRNDLADIAWGPGFVLAILMSWMTQSQPSGHPWLVLILVALWACRLSFYVFQRNRGKPEDFRYLNWRKKWGRHFYWRSYLQIFIVQGFLMLVIGLPVWGLPLWDVSAEVSTVSSLGIFGVLLWAIGFGIEATADWQLARFKKQRDQGNRVSKIMRSGLWRYSRHPNYFGEAVLWWGIFLVAYSYGAPLASSISPCILTYFLMKVSGVPMLEKKYKNNLEYRQYQKQTSSFILWFPAEKV